MVTELVHRLNSLKALKRLDVTLRVPVNNGPTRVTLNQLQHCLPFYFLNFTKWNMWWHNAIMKSPAKIVGKTIQYLDFEATKIIEAEVRPQGNDNEVSKTEA